MSYDITTAHPESDRELFSLNYTSNCSAMWRDAGLDLAGPRGSTTDDLGPLLRNAIAALKADPARYRAMNPSNGWGDYSTGLEFLEAVLDACTAHPKATVYVSC